MAIPDGMVLGLNECGLTFLFHRPPVNRYLFVDGLMVVVLNLQKAG